MLAKPAEFGNFESKSCEGSKNYILLEGWAEMNRRGESVTGGGHWGEVTYKCQAQTLL
jgi:hypothetical protein